MHIWQLQEAKAKLTEFINEAKMEPQVISRHGKPEIVAISMERYNELMHTNKDVVSIFQQSPLYNSGICIDRDKSTTREIDL